MSEYEYTYDGNGNRLTQIERRTGRLDEETTHVYDGLDRLEQVTYPDQTTIYTYDSVGNRIRETSTDELGARLVNRVFSYNSRHQVEDLTDLLDPSASVTYGYDENGNQTTRTTEPLRGPRSKVYRDRWANVAWRRVKSAEHCFWLAV